MIKKQPLQRAIIESLRVYRDTVRDAENTALDEEQGTITAQDSNTLFAQAEERLRAVYDLLDVLDTLDPKQNKTATLG